MPAGGGYDYEYRYVDIPTTIQREPVASSNIAEIGYARTPENPAVGTLEIKFHGKPNNPGRVYQYYDVPWQRVVAFLSSPSMGEYFHRNIRHTFFYAEVTGTVP